MYTKEELETKTVKELYEIAGELGVSRYSHKVRKTKIQLIESIIVVCDAASVSEKTEVKTEAKVEEVVEATPVTSNREAYVDTAKVDMIVAFKLPNGKVKSAKIIKRSTAKRRFMVETKYGAQFVISFDDVVWVKTGTRWPKHVYNLMKGIGNNNG